MISGLMTISETAKRLSESDRTFRRKREFYIAHGLRIVDVSGRPKIEISSFNLMIKNLPDWSERFDEED